MNRRRALFLAALGFALVQVPEPSPPALVALRRWLDTWTGIGHIATGMGRQGYDLALTSDQPGMAGDLPPPGPRDPAVGRSGPQVVGHTVARVQDAAWHALNAPRAVDSQDGSDTTQDPGAAAKTPGSALPTRTQPTAARAAADSRGVGAGRVDDAMEVVSDLRQRMLRHFPLEVAELVDGRL